jgi:hypothetical protein
MMLWVNLIMDTMGALALVSTRLWRYFFAAANQYCTSHTSLARRAPRVRHEPSCAAVPTMRVLAWSCLAWRAMC